MTSNAQIKISPTPTDCEEVYPTTKTVLKANGFSMLHLKFPEEVPSDIYFEDEKGNVLNIEEMILTNESIAYKIPIGAKNKEFNLKRMNICEDIYTLLTYSFENEFSGSGTDGSSEELPIYISNDMSDALVDYTNGQVSLNEFLLSREDLDIFERAYVYQKHVLKNTEPIDIPFPKLAKTPKIIITTGPPPPPPSVTCDCELFATSIEIKPSNLAWSNSTEYKNVYTHLWHYLGENGTKTHLANGGNKWKLWNIMGPGGYRGVWTDGWKEDYGHYDEIDASAGAEDATIEDLEDTNSFRTEIGLNLICMDGQQLPSSCGCDKIVNFDYDYQVSLYTNAKTKSGGGGSKSAIAQAQDLTAIYVKEQAGIGQNDVTTLINGLDLRAAAECDRDVNPDFWNNIFDLTGDVVELYLLIQGVSTESTEYDSLYAVITEMLNNGDNTNILQSIANVIQTPYYSPSNCSSQTRTDGINNTYTTILEPNRRKKFGIFNLHSMVSGGKRSWDSHASRGADFSIATVIQPSDGSDEPLDEDCCVPWVGVYAYLGVTQAEHVEEFFDLYVLPDPIGVGNTDGKGYAGIVTRPASTADCDLYPTVDDIGSREQNENQSTVSSLKTVVAIYTIDGKLIEKYDTVIESENAEEFVRNQLQNRIKNMPTGIFVISIRNENGIQSFKYFK